MPEETWTKLIPTKDCGPGCARFVTIGDLELAVFHLTDPDRFIVTRNSCPRAGGNLSAGTIEANTVSCPWHYWSFDLDNGQCTTSERVTLCRYECRIEDGYVYARLDGA